jgi:hypothetical protein
MTKSLGQAYSIQTFDQQLYTIVKQEIISKALGKRFGIPRTFGFENGRHDVCEEASLVI